MVPIAEPYDVLDENCPARHALDLIADKWTVLVIYALAKGTLRHGQLLRSIHGVSQKMLTQTLRRLEQDGLVHRHVHPVVPPMVEYSLSPLGSTLVEPLAALCQWAEANASNLPVRGERGEGGIT